MPDASNNNKIRYYIAAFLMDTALATGGIGIPLLAKREFHASPLSIGLLAAIGAGAYVSCTALAGHISDRIGRHAVMLLGVIVYCITYALIGLCPSLHLLFLLVIFSGVGNAMFWPCLEAAIADGTSRRRLPVRIGIFNVSWCSSIILGTWLGGRLHDAGPRLPFACAVVISGLLALLLLLVAPPGEKRHVAPSEEPDAVPFPAVSPALQQVFMHMAWGANFVAWGVLGTMRSLFPADAISERLRYTGQEAALLVAAISTAQTLMFALLTVFHGWHYRIGFFVLAQISMMSGTALVAFSVSPGPLALGFLMIGAGAGVTYSSSIYYSLEGLHARGVKSGIHEAFLGAGVFAAPTIGGWLAKTTGDLRAPYVMCVAFIALGLTWQVLMYLRARRQPPGDDLAR